MSRNCRLMILKSRAKIPSTLSMWPKLLDFCVLLFWRTNAIGLTDFATREPWGVFVCPAVSPARFSHSLYLEPGNDTRTKPWKKDRAKVDVAREKSRIVSDWNSASKIPSFGNVSLWNGVGGENDSRRKEVIEREKMSWIEVWRNFVQKWRLFQSRWSWWKKKEFIKRKDERITRNVTFVTISILKWKIFGITGVIL